MTLERQLKFWIAALVVFVLLLWLLSGILLPFVAGLILAYLFRPLADRLERLGMNRLVAALLIVGVVILVFVLIVLSVAPALASQLWSFIGKIPEYVARIQSLLADPQSPWLKRIAGVTETIRSEENLGDIVKQGTGYLTAFLLSLWSGGRALISLFSLLVVMPVVTFYLIADWPRVVRTVDGWVPLHHRETVRGLAAQIDRAISGFLRGQSLVCLLLGTFYAIGLSLVGLNFGLLIGLVAGLITFVPYVGTLTGLVLGIGVAVAQFWPEWTPILMVAGVFAVGQFIEGNILSPKLVGESVGLHPVWLIFALLAFGYLFGFVGLLIAVPLAATLGVLLRFVFARYRASAIYTGRERRFDRARRRIR